MLFAPILLRFSLTGLHQKFEATSPQLQRQASAPGGTASTAMRRGRSSKTNYASASGPGTSRPKPTASHPINIPAPRSSQPWPIHQQYRPTDTSQSLPLPHHARPMFQPSPSEVQDLSLAEYLSQSPDDYPPPGLSVNPFHTVARSESQPQDIFRLSISAAPSYDYDAYSPSICVSEPGLTNTSTATSETMSRVTTNEILIQPLRMCRVGSHHSECTSSDSTTTNDYSSHVVDSSFSESLDSGVLNGLLDSSFMFSPSPSFQPSFTRSSVDMCPSFSQGSDASSSSSDSYQPRHRRTLQDQNAQGKRLLAPKSPYQQDNVSSTTTKFVEIVNADGMRQKKAQIPRPIRTPKETTKVPCPICSDHKEGFHGEHELRRHMQRTHEDYRKVFICKDISPDGTFLRHCKHCRNQKSYGANYNAAAHLRRVHFNPCETPKGGRGKVSQNRGGIGGGDQPAMDVLREWMYESWERNPHSLPPKDDSMAHVSYADVTPSSSDSNLSLSDGLTHISDADLKFVENATHLDLSFLRDPYPFSLSSQPSQIDNVLFASEPDLLFFDPDYPS